MDPMSPTLARRAARQTFAVGGLLHGCAALRSFAVRAHLHAFAAVVGIALCATPSGAAHFHCDPKLGQGLAKFESKAPMESFEGKTNAVGASLELTPDAIAENFQLQVTVDLASLDTGIKLRNQHMCENHLETAKFPQGTFRGAKVVKGAGTSLLDGKPHELLIEGTLQIHGVEKTMQVPVTLTHEKGSPATVRLETTFQVVLSDFAIQRPKMLFMKLSETQKVTVTLTAQEGAPAASPSTSENQAPSANEGTAPQPKSPTPSPKTTESGDRSTL